MINYGLFLLRLYSVAQQKELQQAAPCSSLVSLSRPNWKAFKLKGDLVLTT